MDPLGSVDNSMANDESKHWMSEHLRRYTIFRDSHPHLSNGEAIEIYMEKTASGTSARKRHAQYKQSEMAPSMLRTGSAPSNFEAPEPPSQSQNMARTQSVSTLFLFLFLFFSFLFFSFLGEGTYMQELEDMQNSWTCKTRGHAKLEDIQELDVQPTNSRYSKTRS